MVFPAAISASQFSSCFSLSWQTASSAAFQLYGDPTAPGFIDNAPRDGIDDRRMRVLEALGVRFAPFLVQSSEMVPLDFQAFARGGGLPLHVDLWETAMVERLISEASVDWLDENATPCPTVPDGSADCVGRVERRQWRRPFASRSEAFCRRADR